MAKPRKKCRTHRSTDLNRLGECNLCIMFESGQTSGGHHPSCWPAKSKALSVHPKQVAAANERNRKHGVAAYYERDGTCVLPDRKARRDLIVLERGYGLDGAHDMDGGYGDG